MITSVEDKEICKEWIRETFVKSRDLFGYSTYTVKHWMDEEIGLYVCVDGFDQAIEEIGFSSVFKETTFGLKKFCYMKLSKVAGPIPIKKVYHFSNVQWNSEFRETMLNRLKSQLSQVLQ